jgi:hypothetical protein
MKNSKHIQWLYRELPALMNDGVITAETADKLHAYYGDIKDGSKSRIALIIYGVLGALLVGSASYFCWRTIGMGSPALREPFSHSRLCSSAN